MRPSAVPALLAVVACGLLTACSDDEPREAAAWPVTWAVGETFCDRLDLEDLVGPAATDVIDRPEGALVECSATDTGTLARVSAVAVTSAEGLAGAQERAARLLDPVGTWQTAPTTDVVERAPATWAAQGSARRFTHADRPRRDRPASVRVVRADVMVDDNVVVTIEMSRQGLGDPDEFEAVVDAVAEALGAAVPDALEKVG